jgi:hypothetical protein
MRIHQQQERFGCEGKAGIPHLTNSICRIACATIIAAPLFLMSACTIPPHQSLEAQAFLAPDNNVNQLATNDYINRCGEHARLLKHETALCRTIPLIAVPLQ